MSRIVTVIVKSEGEADAASAALTTMVQVLPFSQ